MAESGRDTSTRRFRPPTTMRTFACSYYGVAVHAFSLCGGGHFR